MKTSREYGIRWHDTDANRIVRPSAILRYMQETANFQCETNGLPLDALRDVRGLAFILSKISLRFHTELHAFDRICVETWVGEGRGFSFPRFFRVRRGDETVAEGASVWALVDLQTKKPIRVSDFAYPFEGDDPIEVDAPVRVHIPADAAEIFAGERRIVWSDLDYNMHMNNTHYPDMLCDFCPGIENLRVSYMSLSYLREAHYRDTLSLTVKEKENERFFRAEGKDGVCLEAVMGICQREEKP